MPRDLGPLIGSIDQGTSSTRFLVFSANTGEMLVEHQVEVRNIYPNEGWVEQDPEEISDSVTKTVATVMVKLKEIDIEPKDIKCVGLTNQRETTVVWDRETGEPLHNAIIWLDNRTAPIVDKILELTPARDKNYYKHKTGLPISTYFSAFKLKWLIDNVPEVKTAVAQDRLMFGTIDSWILYKLLGKHLTDVTNASRTFLFDIGSLAWDPKLCRFFGVPMNCLPEVKSSGEIFGDIIHGPLKGIPFTGVVGDQQGALIGQNGLFVGATKATLGTGCFILQNIGAGTLTEVMRGVSNEAKESLCTTVGYKFGKEPAVYALEGSIAIAGAAVTWLRDNMQLITNYDEVEPLARDVPHSGGVYFVPAFNGLYAPYWDANAAGIIIGLSQFSRKSHIIRATLESVAYQTVDILALMRRDASRLNVDGGMTSNNLLCEILSDLSGLEIVRPKNIEATALGAAMIAGHTLGIWKFDDHVDYEPKTVIKRIIPTELTNGCREAKLPIPRVYPPGSDVFKPTIDDLERSDRISGWKLAVERCMRWTSLKKEEQRRASVSLSL